jgi:redox-sensitive bicupin YhaK (pirin superfamily)
MLRIRKSEERGATKIDWLDSKHTFSFGDYHDQRHIGYGALRVINEDKVKPSAGFNMHRHHNMEIISYVLDGVLEHKDSIGTGSIIAPGDVQRMSAGTGITHSEFNPQNDKPVHFLQIWMMPEKTGIAPSYEQKSFADKRQAGLLTRLASRDGRDNSLTVHQDANIYALDLNEDQSFSFPMEDARMAWIQIVRGNIKLNEQTLKQGDGAAASEEKSLEITALSKAEILIFDLKSN